MKNERNGSVTAANLSLNNHSGNGKSEGKKDFMQSMGLILRRKWEVAGIILTTTLIAVLIAFLSTPLYLAQGTLVMEGSNNNYMSPGSDLGSLLAKNYGLGMSSNVDAEVQLIKSSRLSLKVAQKLANEKIQRNGKLYPVLCVDYPNDSSFVPIDKAAFIISQKLDIKKDQLKGDMVYIAYEGPSQLEAERVVNLVFDVYAELSGEQKRMMTRSAMEFLANEQKRVQQKLLEDEDALKKFMDQKGIVEVQGQTSEIIRSISQLEDARQGVNVKQVSTNSAIEKFQQQLNSLKPGLSEQYVAAVGPTIDRYQYRLAELETEKLLILSRNPGYDKQPDAIPEVKQINEQMESLRNEIRKITSQLSKNSEELLSVPGGQADAAKEVMDLNRRLIQLKVEQSQYQAQSKVIDKQLSHQRGFFQQLPENMVELARLKRSVDQNEKLYKNIAEQYAETALWAETRMVAGRPVDKASVSDFPVKPNKKLLIFSGLVLGLVGSIGYIFLRQTLRIKIDGIEQMKNKQHPLLGVIPDLEQERNQIFSAKGTEIIADTALSQSLLSLHDPLSHFAESCRRLRNNILYSHHENDFKVMAVTSPDMGDGKSTVVANLAVSLAEAGRQVVIIDADLRRPNAHTFFGLNVSPGLNEVISGKKKFE
ncbi:MAG: P-loop NTPase, partial [Chlorobiales bacterium]|nr:P-loop NTPase [Chlorobiales bacterium]